MKHLNEKKMAILLGILFLLSLLPILYLSGYVHATGDDYGYGYQAHRVWLQSGSIWLTLQTAAKTVKTYWYAWQGTWFTIFLMALQPEVFSPDAYWIVPWLMLAITTGTTSLLVHYVMVHSLKLEKSVFWCTDILLLGAMIQYFPSTKSGIFWYNGSAHYIVPYGLAMLVVYAFLSFSDRKRKRDFVMALLCMFCLGGSSYLAPLFALIILCYVLVLEGRKKKHVFWLLIPAAVEMAGLLVSFLAPGNKNRGGDDFGFHWLLVVKTILRCFQEGAWTAVEYVKAYPAVFVCFLIIAVLLFETFGKKETAVEFRFPLLFIALMFCTWCAMFAPGLYAGVELSGGVPNTIFQVFLLTLLASVIYGMGWFSGWCRRKAGRGRGVRCALWILFGVSLVVLGVRKGTLKDTTFYECVDYIRSGQADDYKAQMEERLDILLDDSIRDAKLPAMNSEQGPFMHMEVLEDPEGWTNTVVRQFFNKDSVVQIPREE